jgi:hypothetical protein
MNGEKRAEVLNLPHLGQRQEFIQEPARIAAAAYRADTAKLEAQLAAKRTWLREREPEARRSRAGGKPAPAECTRVEAEVHEIKQILAARGDEQERLDQLAEIARRTLVPTVRRAVVGELHAVARTLLDDRIRPALAELREALTEYASAYDAAQRLVDGGVNLRDLQVPRLLERVNWWVSSTPSPNGSVPTRAERVWVPMRLLLPTATGDGEQFEPGDVIQVPPDVAARLVEHGQGTLHDPFVERDFELAPREWRFSRGMAEPLSPANPIPAEQDRKRERDAREVRERAGAASALAREYPLG